MTALTTANIGGTDSAPVIAKEKVWADASGNLVADGDESAVVLVAHAGQRLPTNRIKAHPNHKAFFGPVNPEATTPAPEPPEAPKAPKDDGKAKAKA